MRIRLAVLLITLTVVRTAVSSDMADHVTPEFISDLRQFLASLRSAVHTLAAYGAPANGNTLLNYCGLDAALLSFTVDQNPLKVGLYTPGTRIPVRPVSALLDEQPSHNLYRLSCSIQFSSPRSEFFV